MSHDWLTNWSSQYIYWEVEQKCLRSPHPTCQLWLPWKLKCVFLHFSLNIRLLVWFFSKEKNVFVLVGSQDSSDLMSPSKRSSQKYIIDGLTEKSSQITDPWERLFKILSVVGMRCEWQMDKGRRWEIFTFPGIPSQGGFIFLVLKQMSWRRTLTWGTLSVNSGQLFFQDCVM